MSLQYVPYAHHYKGLPFQLSTQLYNIGKNQKWHIMFHELWIGMDKESLVKEVLVGVTQKRIVKSLHKTLRPLSIHTQTQLYIAQLKKIGYDAKFLPLCSNIKNYTVRTNKQIDIGVINSNKLRFVLFCGIHFGSPIKSFAKELKQYSDKNKVVISLIHSK